LWRQFSFRLLPFHPPGIGERVADGVRLPAHRGRHGVAVKFQLRHGQRDGDKHTHGGWTPIVLH
jgi:hypothetical protein